MSQSARFIARLFVVSAFAVGLSATTFIIPDDGTFIAKSHAIVIGTVEGSYVRTDGADFPIETVYEIRLQRILKGDFQPDELVSIVSPGGESGKYGLSVPGAASFSTGQKVLLFLTRHKDHLETTDLMLGEFTFKTSPRGARVLVRGDDSVDDHGSGEIRAVDKIRSEDEFIDYIQKALAGKPVAPAYFLEPDQVSLPPAPQPQPFHRARIMTVYTAASYTQVGSGSQGVRWPTATIASALDYARHTGCTGCDPTNADTFITNGMAAWNNDCASTVNLVLTGTTSTAAGATIPDCGICDFQNVIEFGDPQNKLSGSWTGSGTIAVTTIVFTSTPDSAGTGFRQMFDADIVYQDGYLPNNEASAPQATTHELGHSIGWRHSNADPSTPNGQTENCNSLTAECAGGGFGGSAIMFWQVSSLGYTLQTWDQDAIRAVYPGGACSAPSAPTNVVAAATTSTSISVTWTASATGSAPITYQVQRSAAGTSGFANIGSSTSGTTLTDTLGSSTAIAYLYRVVASNSAGSATSSHDLATNVIFTDDPLSSSIAVKTTHITELRTAIDAVRKLANNGVANNYSYTDSTLTGGTTPIKGVHLTDLRTALDAARSSLSLSALSYTDTTINSSVNVKAQHFTELRNGVK